MPRVKVCFAQALDNISPDHVFLDEKELSVQAEQERREACSLLSSVSMNGKKIYDADGVRLFLAGNIYVLEVLPQQLDFVDRAAPLAMCIVRNEQDDADGVAKEVQKYAELMNRTVAGERLESVRKAIYTLAKKKDPTAACSRSFKFVIRREANSFN
jgi:hypothetical protein